MADLITGNTDYPITLDTSTLLANDTDEIVVEHLNGFGKALVAVETALGVSPAGTAASLAARLANVVSLDGGLLYGITLPDAPSNLPHFFYNTQTDVLYVRNPNTAMYDIIANATTLGSYLQKDSAEIITAQHTFAPVIAQAPFVLSANAQGQKVIGFDADTVDGKNPGSTNGLATLDGSSLVIQNPTNATATPTASKIPIADGAGKLVAGWGGAASTLATLNASGKVVEEPASKAQASGIASLNAGGLVVQKPADEASLSVATAAACSGNAATSSSCTGNAATATTATNALHVNGYHVVCTYASSGSLTAGSEETVSVSLGNLDFASVYPLVFVVNAVINFNETTGYKASYKATYYTSQDIYGALHYTQGGYGTLPSDPGVPAGLGYAAIRVKNNSASTGVISISIMRIYP